MLTRRWFDGTVLVVVLTTIALQGLTRAWSRKHMMSNGQDSVGGRTAGTVELVL